MSGMAKVVWLRSESSPPMEKAAVLLSFHLEMCVSPVAHQAGALSNTATARKAMIFIMASPAHFPVQ